MTGSSLAPPPGWLPPGKSCAVCFSIDDVHPARAVDGFDAGGDLADGALGHVLWLAERHPALKTTLGVTPDWRPRTPLATRRILARLPGIADRSYLSPRWPEGRMQLDNHPGFVAFLKAMPRVEIVPHGLHHIQRGRRGPAEFERADHAESTAALAQIARIMAGAGLTPAAGHIAPGWAAPPPFRRALKDFGMAFIASSRDVTTAVAADAIGAMSGLAGQPLFFPARTVEGLVHIPTNFQATSDVARAEGVLALGGLLSVKAHIVKSIGGYTALDGLDRLYANYLHLLFARLEDRFGDAIWWASMGEIAARMPATETSQ